METTIYASKDSSPQELIERDFERSARRADQGRMEWYHNRRRALIRNYMAIWVLMMSLMVLIKFMLVG